MSGGNNKGKYNTYGQNYWKKTSIKLSLKLFIKNKKMRSVKDKRNNYVLDFPFRMNIIKV
jgi:hypothetical protein